MSHNGPSGQFLFCGLLSEGLDFFGVINVDGSSVAAAEDESSCRPASPSPTGSTSSLFGDGDDDDDDDLFGDRESSADPSGGSSSASSLFSDGDDDDDLFGDKEAFPDPPRGSSPCPSPSADQDEETLAALFEAASPARSPSPSPSALPDEDILAAMFMAAPDAGTSSVPASLSRGSPMPSEDMDADGDDDDIFGDVAPASAAVPSLFLPVVSPSALAVPAAPATPARTEAEDEDVIFVPRAPTDEELDAVLKSTADHETKRATIGRMVAAARAAHDAQEAAAAAAARRAALRPAAPPVATVAAPAAPTPPAAARRAEKEVPLRSDGLPEDKKARKAELRRRERMRPRTEAERRATMFAANHAVGRKRKAWMVEAEEAEATARAARGGWLEQRAAAADPAPAPVAPDGPSATAPQPERRSTSSDETTAPPTPTASVGLYHNAVAVQQRQRSKRQATLEEMRAGGREILDLLADSD